MFTYQHICLSEQMLKHTDLHRKINCLNMEFPCEYYHKIIFFYQFNGHHCALGEITGDTASMALDNIPFWAAVMCGNQCNER